MNIKAARSALNELQSWRNKVIGVGLMLPDLTDLLKMLEDQDKQVQALRDERTRLESDTRSIKDLIQQAKSELRECQDAITATKADLAKERQSLDRLRRDLQGLVNEMDARRNEEEAKLRASLESIEVEHKSRLTQILDEISQKSDEFDKVRRAFDSFKREHGLA